MNSLSCDTKYRLVAVSEFADISVAEITETVNSISDLDLFNPNGDIIPIVSEKNSNINCLVCDYSTNDHYNAIYIGYGLYYRNFYVDFGHAYICIYVYNEDDHAWILV